MLSLFVHEPTPREDDFLPESKIYLHLRQNPPTQLMMMLANVMAVYKMIFITSRLHFECARNGEADEAI
jgi:hypothetical protein